MRIRVQLHWLHLDSFKQKPVCQAETQSAAVPAQKRGTDCGKNEPPQKRNNQRSNKNCLSTYNQY